MDAETGTVRWTNDGISATYINHPHNGAAAFANVAPQGALAIVGDRLLVPGGRSVPACLDLATGRLLYFHLSGSRFHRISGSPDRKLEGGSHVCGIGNYFFNHRSLNTGFYDLATGEMCGMRNGTTYPVLTDEVCYLSGNPVVAYRLGKSEELADGSNGKPSAAGSSADSKSGKKQSASKQSGSTKSVGGQSLGTLDKLWECAVDGTGALIKSGSRLYAGGENVVSALDLRDEGPPAVAWSSPIEGTVARILAADDRLFAVTLQGRIYAFGADRRQPKTFSTVAKNIPACDEMVPLAEELVEAAPITQGYCLAFGLGKARLLSALAKETEFRIIGVDPDPKKVAFLRHWFDDAGMYGTRISLHVGTPTTFEAPPYVAALTLVENLKDAGSDRGDAFLEKLFYSMRPYGGVAYLPISDPRGCDALAALARRCELAGAKVKASGDHVLFSREGPLPGSDDWTHQYGDIANTTKSDDKLVRLPLGVLWFGGNTHADILPRHGHGPPEQVIGGRLFVEGINMLSARDVYSGRVLWKRLFDDLGTFGVYYDASYKEDPLDTSYNQVHLPGANVRGTNFVATEDKVYLVVGGKCIVMDVATGQTIETFSLPVDGDSQQTPTWGYIGVYEDLLIAGANLIPFSKQHKLKVGIWDNFDTSSSKALVVMDRHSGRVRWTRKSDYGFRHNAIAVGAGKLFCIDCLPESVLKTLQRRGRAADARSVLRAFDVHTGELVWTDTEHVFGTWLSYSDKRDILLQSGRASRDMVQGEPTGRIVTYRGRNGELVWDKPVEHGGPCMIHGDTIYLNAVQKTGGAVGLLTGEPVTRQHPLTGQKIPWRYHRTYGCNSVIASEYLLSFRSGAAGYYDLQNDGGTGTLGGFKSGCTSNLIAANGVLNAPDYTRTCTCTYQNQTSLALVHMPDVEVWTFNQLDAPSDGKTPIRRVGINFGAPGDRRAADGTLWLDYPGVGGPSPQVPIEVEGTPIYFRHHASRIDGPDRAWIGASGVERASRISLSLVSEDAARSGLVVPIVDEADDAEEDLSGAVNYNSSDLELTRDKTPQTVGLRFQSVPISQGNKIKRAYVQMEVDEVSSKPTRLTIHGQAVDSAPQFTSKKFDISVREKTTNAVQWEPGAWAKKGEAAEAQRTPDLSGILQEIVDRSGWKKHGSLALLIDGNGKRVAKAFAGDKPGAARLHIELDDSEKGKTEKPLPPRYTVRLYFVEPDNTVKPGERIFDVGLQGMTVLSDFDVRAEAQRAHRLVVKEFHGVPVPEKLIITMTPSTARPAVLCGAEAVAEKP